MSQDAIELVGTLEPDGTLVLDQKLNLPAGRVRVTVQPLPTPEAPNPGRFWALMQSIWDDQKARGHVSRTKEEIDSDLQTMHGEWQERHSAVERLQDNCRQAREEARRLERL